MRDTGLEAERKQLTVLFCDLVGSTRLSEQLDPEDLREVVRSYQEVASLAIDAGGGYLAQYLGDGILAYFGYPKAHEDDARRAIRAGLALVARVADLGERSRQHGRAAISVRVGIETGLVVVGDMGAGTRAERLAIGDTPNVAARLQALAQPGEVVIGERTQRLVDGIFDLRALGPQTLKGVSAEVPAYAVDRERRIDRPVALRSPLVGRAAELAVLSEAFRDAAAGNGRAITIVAEPGIGKSRLVLAAKEQWRDSNHDMLDLQCSPYAQNTDLYPVVTLLRRRFGLDRDDRMELRWARIRDTIARSTSLSPETAPLFASLLSVPIPERPPQSDKSPSEQRRATLETLTAWLIDAAEGRPQVLVAEDLQWADPTTIELLGSILERIGESAVLCVFTFRPEFAPPWEPSAVGALIELERLDASDTARLATAAADGTSLPSFVLNEIVRRTDGVPLFAEELTKALVESGQLGATGQVDIPPTLQSSLMARLDRLADDAKAFAQIASVLGRDVRLDVLQAVANVDRQEVDRLCGALASVGLLAPTEGKGPVECSFKHALVQETAYGSMLKSVRRQRHSAVARTLEEQFPELVAAQPELIARHWREGGQPQAALRWFGEAGATALGRWAAREAAAHFREAIELVTDAGVAGTSAEVPLQVGLGGALIVSEGYVTPEVAGAFDRALGIGSQRGDGPELLPALHGLWLHALIGGRIAEAAGLSDRMLVLSQQLDSPNLLAEAEYARGLTALFMGNAGKARVLLESAIGRLDPNAPRVLLTEHKADASFRIFLAAALCITGFAEEAAEVAARAVDLADAHGHPFTLGTVLAWDGVVLQLLGRDADAAQAGIRGVAVSEANGLPFWQLASTLVVASSAPADQRVESLPPLIAAYNGIGARVMETHFRLRLADAHRTLGHAEEALGVLTETARVAEATGQAWLEPQRLQMEGEILHAQGDPTAQSRFRAAEKLARAQGSRVLPLHRADSGAGGEATGT